MESGPLRARFEDEGPSNRSPSPPVHPVHGQPSLTAPSLSKQGPNPSPPSDAIENNDSRPPLAPIKARGKSRGRSTSKRPQRRGESKNPVTRSWAAVASGVHKGYDLEYTPPTIVNNKPVIQMTESDLEAVDPKLFECLVGYFIGRRLPFKVIEEALKKAWGPNLLEVMSNGRGLFVLRIPDREFRRKILEGGHITIARMSLVLQQWKPGLELSKDIHRSVPVWVRLRNLPFSFWSAQSIGKVASAVGKPLYVDQRTEQMTMLTFTRVCVEITAQQPTCESIELLLDGKSLEVEVEYEWKPLACPVCGIFGHSCKTAAPTNSVVPSAEANQVFNASVGTHPAQDKSVHPNSPTCPDGPVLPQNCQKQAMVDLQVPLTTPGMEMIDPEIDS
ncbi:hypothetical protein ACJRO7_021305 [Eucalyptus globulus]|uniref:DUF4283 domain-containing protein n=1 Tax=Eucalyptus globulus TaxID=34317 RepID=A0ABD3KJB9_EUCGL